MFRYIAEQALEDGVNSNIYICGMLPVEDDMPCTDIFQCDLSLTCTSPIEMDFYSISRPFLAVDDFQRDPIMCSICADTSPNDIRGVVDAVLKTIFACVVTICATCKRKGTKISVGRYLPNGQALLKRLSNSHRAVSATLHAELEAGE